VHHHGSRACGRAPALTSPSRHLALRYFESLAGTIKSLLPDRIEPLPVQRHVLARSTLGPLYFIHNESQRRLPGPTYNNFFAHGSTEQGGTYVMVQADKPLR